MNDIAKAAYEALETGHSGFMRPGAGHDALAHFQSVHEAALAMHKDGLIFIQRVHRESSSGRHLIDSIQFMRVK